MTHGPIDGVVVGKHPLVCRLLKGIYNQRPPQPRYSCTWDVGLVLDHIRSWGPTVTLTQKKISLKLAMLLALANASRCSELHSLDTQYMSWNKSGVTFSLAALTKTSKPGKDKALFFPRLEADKEMCPVASLIQYLQKTKSIRRDHTLFISYVKPYGAVQACTIARWIKDILKSAGFGDFRAHSTRGAAVSAAYMQGMSVPDILAVADWSTDSMFRRFYFRADMAKQQSLMHSLVQK